MQGEKACFPPKMPVLFRPWRSGEGQRGSSHESHWRSVRDVMLVKRQLPQSSVTESTGMPRRGKCFSPGAGAACSSVPSGGAGGAETLLHPVCPSSMADQPRKVSHSDRTGIPCGLKPALEMPSRGERALS